MTTEMRVWGAHNCSECQKEILSVSFSSSLSNHPGLAGLQKLIARWGIQVIQITRGDSTLLANTCPHCHTQGATTFLLFGGPGLKAELIDNRILGYCAPCSSWFVGDWPDKMGWIPPRLREGRHFMRPPNPEDLATTLAHKVLTCRECGTQTDQWSSGDYKTGLCLCYDCRDRLRRSDWVRCQGCQELYPTEKSLVDGLCSRCRLNRKDDPQ